MRSGRQWAAQRLSKGLRIAWGDDRLLRSPQADRKIRGTPHQLDPNCDPKSNLHRVPQTQNHGVSSHFVGVSEGTRTPDRLDHNQELYQLSYAHHGSATAKSSAGSALLGGRLGGLAFGQGERLAGRKPGGARGDLAPGGEQ
jgi:hypothetical protein